MKPLNLENTKKALEYVDACIEDFRLTLATEGCPNATALKALEDLNRAEDAARVAFWMDTQDRNSLDNCRAGQC